MARYCILLLQSATLCVVSHAVAAPPSETLLPANTKGYLSVPDVEQLRLHWNETQLGRMVNDPVMKPFVDDLRAQIQAKMSTTRMRLGLTLEDLDDIYGGELCLAAVQPGNDPDAHATVLLVDVTEHLEQATAMLDKASKNLVEQGAAKRTVEIGGQQVLVFTMPKKREDSPTVEAHYLIYQNLLIACDHPSVCQQIIAQLDGKAGQTLAQVEAFEATMTRCTNQGGELVPHIRWYIEPFGYAHTVRAAAGGRRRKGVDLLKVLPNQGFDAIQGVGGHIFLATGDEEMLHRTMIYAPSTKPGSEQSQAEEGHTQRYTLAARMLEFPNTDTLQPQSFVSRDLGAYITFNWKMIDAFEYSKSLVNELLNGGKDDDLMEDIIVGLAEDKDGPQVDLRKDLVAHFAERASLISDCRRPISPDSERLMVAIELTDPEAVRQTVDKAFRTDPDAERREFEGHVIWEIIKDNVPAEVDEIEIGGDIDVFDPFGEANVPEPVEFEDNADEKILPNSAITVANGHLIVATHVDFIVEMLERPIGTDLLVDAADHQQVQDALAKIGADKTSFRFFARSDETYRPTYELIRQGKMPEAKTVLGRLLNSLLGPDEKGILREQQIDGSKMPEFDAVRRYLGPGGMYVQSEENGWFMAGCLLSKERR